MIFLLALVDILCAVALLLYLVGHAFPPLQAGAAILLLGKAFLFLGDFLSILDIGVAALMLLLLWVQLPLLALCAAVYLCMKGLYSFV